MFKKIKTSLKRIRDKYFDYDIVRSVYDTDGYGVYRIKHIRKYKLRKRGKIRGYENE